MVDLRQALRTGGSAALDAALDCAMHLKPKGHDFVLDRDQPGPAYERDGGVARLREWRVLLR